MYDVVFGDRLVEKLKSRKMTQRELAAKIGRSE
jgi:transcriptional regulator with XRE-family HTH domain